MAIDDIKGAKTEVDAATASVQGFNAATTSANSVLQGFGNFIKQAGGALKNLTGDLVDVSRAQQQNQILMQNHANVLGVMTSAVLGASKAFSGMTETTGINRFGESIGELIDTASRAKAPFVALGSVASAFGIDAIPKAGEAVEHFASRLSQTIQKTLEGADAALKFQNAFLQMSAASGNMGRVFEQTGGNLRSINDLLQTQGLMLANAAAATNADTKTTTAYYTELGRIPGYLNSQAESSDSVLQHMNMLTAAMKLAHGTGQDQAEVIQELTTAYENYGASGEKALDFTARISELSQQYNVRLQDTREYMTQTAQAFRFLGENVDSSAKMFEGYFSRLRETGLSTRAAVDITEEMTKSLSNMTLAQKAFLSARTGGPGGLVGAIQIEQQIRGGDMSGVMRRIEETLKQQFGRIVTQQEAATNEQSAAQFVRQRMFLTQGPFGQLVQGEGQATRLLEALGKPGGVGAISQTEANKLLSQDIKRGSEVEQKSYTVLTQLNTRVEAIRMLSGIIALGVTQRGLTPGGGVETALGRQLLGGIRDAMSEGRKDTRQGTETAHDRSALNMSQGIQGVYRVLDTLGTTGHSIEAAAEATMTTKNELVREQANMHTRQTNEVHRAATQTIAQRQITVKHDPHTADALMAASKTKATPPPPQNITVTLNSVCPNCHKKYVTNQQQTAINNAPGQFSAGF